MSKTPAQPTPAHPTPANSAPEFSRVLGLHEIGDGRREREVSATPEECAALVRRFGLREITRLEARTHIVPEATGCRIEGTLMADLVQACVATDEDVPAHLEATIALRFVRGMVEDPDDVGEIDLSDEDVDVLPLEDERIDLGEAIAQTLVLKLNPYPRVADADQKLRELGVLTEEDVSPFAILKGLTTGGKG